MSVLNLEESIPQDVCLNDSDVGLIVVGQNLREEKAMRSWSTAWSVNVLIGECKIQSKIQLTW